MRDKKSQITLFIIIGIVLLLATGIVLYVRSQYIVTELEVQLELDKVSEEAKPVQDYVVQCLVDTGSDAVKRIASHGGYLGPGNASLTTTSFVINPDDPTQSDVVELIDDHLIPYWWFMEGNNMCEQCFVTIRNIPSIDMMEDDVSRYVDMQLSNCLDEFEAFAEKGVSVVPQGEYQIDTDIAEGSVYVQINYPLQVNIGGATESMENFYGEIPADLWTAYHTAKEITELEIQQQFLEQILMNLITAYSGLDTERLPPIASFTEGYVILFWLESNVEDQLQEILMSHIPLIQLENTKDAEKISPETEVGEGFTELLFIDNEKDFNDMEVNFVFKDWPIFLEITPKQGELLRPSSFRDEFPLSIAPPLQTNHYVFFYDVSYPTIVHVRDTNAFGGQGLNFMMALESNVRNNRDIVRWINGEGTDEHWDYNLVDIDWPEDLEIPAGYDPETNETVYEPLPEPTPTLICNQEQRISGEIEVAVYDKKTNDPIGDAAISYNCGNYDSCNIGAADSSGHYSGQFPICVGGFLKADKEGYLAGVTNLTTMPEEDQKVMIFLEPYREKKVEIKLLPTSRLNESISVAQLKGLAFDPDNNDETIINLMRAPEKIFEPIESSLAQVNGREIGNISLLPGTYQIEITFLKNDGIYIPATTKDYEGYEVDYPEVNMTPAFLGGASFNEETGYLVIDEETLDSKSTITFYVFRMNDPYEIEQLGEMGQFANYSNVYREFIEPDWS